MGQYKVPQNVEAEDHILGPLTFKQFIYGLSGFLWAAACFSLFRSVPAVMLIVGFPPTMLLMLLAFFKRDGQDFESLLIAMIAFFSAPHMRIWVKDDLIEQFHIEPTKKAAEVTQRNPKEVISELEKVSKLLDSRGWNLPPEQDPSLIRPSMPAMAHSDRIVAPPPPAPHAPDEPRTDMLDLKSSPLAQNLSELLSKAADDVREEAMTQMTTKPTRQQIAASTSGVTQAPGNDILKLATLNNDLTVSQIAAQATRLAPAPAQVQAAPAAPIRAA